MQTMVYARQHCSWLALSQAFAGACMQKMHSLKDLKRGLTCCHWLFSEQQSWPRHTPPLLRGAVAWHPPCRAHPTCKHHNDVLFDRKGKERTDKKSKCCETLITGAYSKKQLCWLKMQRCLALGVCMAQVCGFASQKNIVQLSVTPQTCSVAA